MAPLAAVKLNYARWLAMLLLLAVLPRSATALDVIAKAAVLMNVNSGILLWTKNQNLQLPPASTAKILTASIVLERNRIDETVRIPAIATKATGTTIPLAPGEELNVESLLFAMLLGSANDAALALAHHSGGSVDKFVVLMNRKAQSLGAMDSKFLNPTGLPQSGQLSTAHGLALITRAALANADFRRIVATKKLPWKSSHRQDELKNSNRLLDDYKGAIGVKTGNTNEAGFCLVAAASRGNQSYIAVILNSSEKAVWQDAKRLLDYGFVREPSDPKRPKRTDKIAW
jgi:D-alanyl-D-alanine carboxypeptidase (penicillin-binding protein 5/6)